MVNGPHCLCSQVVGSGLNISKLRFGKTRMVRLSCSFALTWRRSHTVDVVPLSFVASCVHTFGYIAGVLRVRGGRGGWGHYPGSLMLMALWRLHAIRCLCYFLLIFRAFRCRWGPWREGWTCSSPPASRRGGPTSWSSAGRTPGWSGWPRARWRRGKNGSRRRRSGEPAQPSVRGEERGKYRDFHHTPCVFWHTMWELDFRLFVSSRLFGLDFCWPRAQRRQELST